MFQYILKIQKAEQLQPWRSLRLGGKKKDKYSRLKHNRAGSETATLPKPWRSLRLGGKKKDKYSRLKHDRVGSETATLLR